METWEGVKLYHICMDEVIFQPPRAAAEASTCLQNTEVGGQQMLGAIWVIAQNWTLLTANSSLLA